MGCVFASQATWLVDWVADLAGWLAGWWRTACLAGGLVCYVPGFTGMNKDNEDDNIYIKCVY